MLFGQFMNKNLLGLKYRLNNSFILKDFEDFGLVVSTKKCEVFEVKLIELKLLKFLKRFENLIQIRGFLHKEGYNTGTKESKMNLKQILDDLLEKKILVIKK